MWLMPIQTKSNLSLSVVIPTYNEENFIGPCLEALLNQSQPPDEVIVVDNNSTDATVDIAQSYKGVKVLKESQQGQLYARTKGFNFAKSNILATVDADCLVLPGWAEAMLSTFRLKNFDAIGGYVTSRDAYFVRFFEFMFNFVLYKLNRLLVGHHVLFGSNMAITKNFWFAVKSDLRADTSLWEDYDMAMIGGSKGLKIGLLDKPLVDMSLRRANMPIMQLHAYFSGWYKTFWPYHKMAAIGAYLICWVAIAGIFAYKPFLFMGRRIRTQLLMYSVFK
jgi:glycosyltransferase involved in cell wall biosynthesis